MVGIADLRQLYVMLDPPARQLLVLDARNEASCADITALGIAPGARRAQGHRGILEEGTCSCLQLGDVLFRQAEAGLAERIDSLRGRARQHETGQGDDESGRASCRES